MPFLVINTDTTEKLYIRRSGDDLLWGANKAKATRFSSDEADAVAADINKYSDGGAEVVGAGGGDAHA